MDIVYVLKNDIEPYELRYSLRSLKNFPHDKVWFFGGEPAFLKPDRIVYVKQKGGTPWARVSYTLRKVCENPEVSEDFYLFNDDFFIMKPLENYQPRYNGSLYQHAREIEERHNGKISGYTAHLRETARALEEKGYSTLNYAMHVPMLINKKKALEVLDEFPNIPMFRSLYGNKFSIGGVNTHDVKIMLIDKEPSHNAEMISTADNSFLVGKVGAYIKSQFPERCEYETD